MKCSPTTRNHCGQRRARGRGRGRGTGREREGEGEGDGDGEGVGDIFIDAEKSRLEQIVGKDWVKIIEGHSNQAHTTLKFFMAGKSDKKNSDYHENFTFEETVKIYVATALAWPDFCLHNQLLQNKGRLAKDDGKPWFDFNEGKALRQLHVLDDNAPYNYGVQVCIKDATKQECVQILRVLGVESIPIIHHYKDGKTPPLTFLTEVPKDGEKWAKQKDSPNADEVCAAILAYLKKHHPNLLKPAFQYVLDKYGIGHSHTVAYTSNNIAEEFVWVDIKGYAGEAENQSISRTPAETVELLRSKLFRPVLVANELKDPIPMSTWFDHVRDNWNQWIQLDAGNGGKLSGKLGALVGVPPIDSAEWKE